MGQTVQASYQSPTLFIVAADLTKMKCTANIDESEVGKIRPGQIVRLRIDAYPTETFTGKVIQVRLQPVVVQNVVTYGTVIDVPNLEYKLKPGMTANVVDRDQQADRRRARAEHRDPVPADRGDLRGVQPGSAARAAAARHAGARGRQPHGRRQPAAGGARTGQGAPARLAHRQPARRSRAQARAGAETARPSQRGGGDATPGSTPQFGANRPGAPGRARASAARARSRQGMGGGQQFARGEGGQGAQGTGGGVAAARGFDPNDPEAVKRMLERYQQMPADQKAPVRRSDEGARDRHRGARQGRQAGRGAGGASRGAGDAARAP